MPYITPSYPESNWDGHAENYSGPEQSSAGKPELTDRIIAEIIAIQNSAQVENPVLDAFAPPHASR